MLTQDPTGLMPESRTGQRPGPMNPTDSGSITNLDTLYSYPSALLREAP